MKVLFIHQYFCTPEEGGGIRSYHMAKTLVESGHEVEVITAYNQSKYQVREIEAIKVHYLPVYYDNKLGFVGRSFAFIKFVIFSLIKASSIKNPDICYASSSPLTVAIIALYLKKFKRLPYIFEVMDLWPEAPIQMGFIKSPILKKLLYWLEKEAYLNAEKIVAASPGMAEGVIKVAPAKNVVVIPNVADCTFFTMEQKKDELLKKYKVDDKFVVCYIGALGLANDVEAIINLARYFQEKDNEIHLIIAGQGALFPKARTLSKEYRLNNITFMGHVSKETIREILNVSDINLVTFLDKPILQTNSPNKFFDGLASGKLSVVNSDGWLKDLCEEHECGFHLKLSAPELFLDRINYLRKNPTEFKKYQNNARHLGEKEFCKEILMTKFLDLFNPQKLRP